MGTSARKSGFVATMRYHGQIAKQVPDLLWRSGERWVTAPLVILGIVGLFSPVSGRWLSALWFGAPFWLSLGLLVAIFIYYLVKANHAALLKVEGERDAAQESRTLAEQALEQERRKSGSARLGPAGLRTGDKSQLRTKNFVTFGFPQGIVAGDESRIDAENTRLYGPLPQLRPQQAVSPPKPPQPTNEESRRERQRRRRRKKGL